MKTRFQPKNLVLGLTLAIAGTLSMTTQTMAQTTDPYVNQLLNQAYNEIQGSQQLLNQVHQQLQQEENYWKYHCQQGNNYACQQLDLFYQRRMRGYEAEGQYWDSLRNSGWADSFGTFGD